MSDLSHDKFGSVLIDGYNIGGMGFDRYRQIQRAGLALATKPGGEKALVIAFGGGEGQGTPSGWVIAFDVFKTGSRCRPSQRLVECSEQRLRIRRRRKRVDGQCRIDRG